MKFHVRLGAIGTSHGDATRVAVFSPGYYRTVCASAAIATCAVLAGCGASTSGIDPAESVAPVVPANTEVTTPSPVAEPDTDADADDSYDLAPKSETVGADVLLLQPAGKADLPLSDAPAIAFKSLPQTTTLSLEARLRAESRNPVTADGGRSGTAFTTSVNGNETLTGNVTISWDPPAENADGSSINDLAGYRVYQGNSEQLSIVQELNETGAGERRLAQVTNVASNNACFAVTAIDTSANESALGDVVCKDIVVATTPVNDQTPNLNSVNQLSSSDGVATVQLIWTPPSQPAASAGADVVLYSIYHGSQSQLFKINEVSDLSTRNGLLRQYTVSGISGQQACFALTARYNDGLETLLSEIVCVALVHSTAPQPGAQLRPFNITVDLVGANTAQIGWDKPNTVVSSADATGIDRYDLYQGSRSQVYKLSEISETGADGSRRTTTVDNVFDGSDCFALTATDDSRRQSALSTIVCAGSPSPGATPTPTPPSGSVGITALTAQETSPGSVAIAWDAPELVAAGQPIANLSGYNIYQGSNTQLFKVAEQNHVNGAVHQQIQRTSVDASNACFAVTAFDSNGFEAPLSQVVCANISGTASVPQFGIVPPTDLATRALGGSTTVTLSWLASGAAATGAADPNVNRYNIYQGNHDRLFKVRQVLEDHDSDPRSSTAFTGVTPDSACFAITAQYLDLRESRLSDIVCRDD